MAALLPLLLWLSLTVSALSVAALVALARVLRMLLALPLPGLVALLTALPAAGLLVLLPPGLVGALLAALLMSSRLVLALLPSHLLVAVLLSAHLVVALLLVTALLGLAALPLLPSLPALVAVLSMSSLLVAGAALVTALALHVTAALTAHSLPSLAARLVLATLLVALMLVALLLSPALHVATALRLRLLLRTASVVLVRTGRLEALALLCPAAGVLALSPVPTLLSAAMLRLAALSAALSLSSAPGLPGLSAVLSAALLLVPSVRGMSVSHGNSTPSRAPVHTPAAAKGAATVHRPTPCYRRSAAGRTAFPAGPAVSSRTSARRRDVRRGPTAQADRGRGRFSTVARMPSNESIMVHNNTRAPPDAGGGPSQPRERHRYAYHDDGGAAKLSTTVVHALADVMGRDVTDTGWALADYVDPDALDRLFSPPGDGSPDGSRHVAFAVEGYRVTVYGDGQIVITPPA